LATSSYPETCQNQKSLKKDSIKIDGNFSDWKQFDDKILCISDPEGDPVHDFIDAGLGKSHDIKMVCIAHDSKNFYFLYVLLDSQAFDTYSEGCGNKCGSNGQAPKISYYQIYLGSPKNGASGYKNPTFPGIAGTLHYEALIETAYSFNPLTGIGGSKIQNQEYNMWFDIFTDYQQKNPFQPPDYTSCCQNLRNDNWKTEIPVLNFKFGYFDKDTEAIEIEVSKSSICGNGLDCSELYFIATSSELLNCYGDDFTEPLFTCPN
jgi:hypothetical protein